MPPSSTPCDPNDLLANVERTLADHAMLEPGDRVLVGVSGGPDSMALLHLLTRLAPQMEVTLGVAHLNHCLRGASADNDAEIVRMAAASIPCPCHVRRARVPNVKRGLGLSLEDAARRVRYAFFRKIMRDHGYTKLALGHHGDDNAEQVLLALLRGTGPLGLSGIAPVRGNWLVRPLIRARRFQIASYAKVNGIDCIQDATNADQRFSRNRIRHHLLPLLASHYNPRITEHLNRLADMMRTEETWIDGLVAERLGQVVTRRTPHKITLSIDNLRQSHPAMARRLIRRALTELTGTLRRIAFTHVQSVLALIEKGADEKETHLPRGVRARCSGDRLMLFTCADGLPRGTAGTIAVPAFAPTVISGPFPASVSVASMGIGLRLFPCRPGQLPRWSDVGPEQAYIDLDRVSLPLTLRPAAPGDRFTPLGCTGSQKLKKFFIDHRIPRRVRGTTPVLADTRKIVWLMGHRIDDAVKVTAKTSQVLGMEFFLLDTR